jgi:hypothetical protein
MACPGSDPPAATGWASIKLRLPIPATAATPREPSCPAPLASRNPTFATLAALFAAPITPERFCCSSVIDRATASPWASWPAAPDSEPRPALPPDPPPTPRPSSPAPDENRPDASRARFAALSVLPPAFIPRLVAAGVAACQVTGAVGTNRPVESLAGPRLAPAVPPAPPAPPAAPTPPAPPAADAVADPPCPPAPPAAPALPGPPSRPERPADSRSVVLLVSVRVFVFRSIRSVRAETGRAGTACTAPAGRAAAPASPPPAEPEPTACGDCLDPMARA